MDSRSKEFREYIYQKYGQGINRRLWDSLKSMDNPVFNQESWRVQFATGETAAFKELLNTDHTILVIVGGATNVVALRFLIQDTTAGGANNKTFQLEARIDGGTPFDVTAISADVKSSGLSLLGTDTTQRIGSGTFIGPLNDGVDEDDGIAGGTALDFAGNDECELLYSVQFPNSEIDGTEFFEFRLKGVDTFTAPEWLGIHVNLVLDIPVASLVLTGFVPTAVEGGDVTIEVPLGTLALTGLVPLALENTIINIPVGNLPLAGFAPEAVESTLVNVPVASLALTGFTPTLKETIPIPIASLVLTGFVPSVVENTTVEVPTGQPGIIIDNFDSTTAISTGLFFGDIIRQSQAWTGDGNDLAEVDFELHKIGTPPGNMVAKLYATSGTFGTNMVPSGGALAVSDTLVADDVITSTSGSSPDTITFVFSIPFTTISSTKYCVTIEYNDSGSDVNNRIFTNINTGHAGNRGQFISSWVTATSDIRFEVRSPNRLKLLGKVPTVLESLIINIPVGSLVLTGFVPTPVETGDTTINIPVGSLALTSFAVTIDELIPIPLATLTLTSFVPLALESTVVNVPVGALNLTGLVPSVKESTDISIPLSSLALTGLAPVAVENEIINIPVASLALTGFAPTVLEGVNIDVPIGSLVLIGFAVIPGEDIVEIIPLVTLVITGLVPSALENTIINIPVASLTLTGFVPVAQTEIVIDIPTGSLVLTGFIPLVLENTIINIPVASLTLTGFVPLVLEGNNVTVPLASLTLTGFVVTPGENVVEIIPLGTLTLTGFDTTHDIAIPIPVASLSLTGFAIAVIEGTIVNIPVASLALTGLAPLVLETTIIDIPIGSLVLTGFAPATIFNIIVDVPTASLALTSFVVKLDEGISIPLASLTLTGFIPTLKEETIINIPVATLSLSGFAPEAVQDTSIEVPLANLTLTGFIPVPVETTNDVVVSVPTVSITLTGFAPNAIVGGDEVIQIPVTILRLISFAPNVVITLFNIETCDMDIIFPKDVDKLVIPVLQIIEFNLERLKNINLPDPVIVDDIGEFKSLEPVAPSKEVERITFLYADFALTTQNVIDGKIGELIGEVKPYNVELIEWGRQKEDLIEESEESIEVSFDGEASRGFVAPSGVFSKDISKQSLKLKKNVSRANEVFFSGQNAKTLQNMTDGLQAGNQAEVIVRQTDKERQTINLQAVQNLVEIDFRVFELYLQRHNSSIEIKRIKHQAWLEEIRAQLLILQEREMAIKGYTLNLVERSKQVEMFNIAIDYLNAKQALKEIDLENFILQAETEKNKLLKFQAEVDKFSALINLNIAKFNLYKAGINFEESKVDRFREEAAVAGAQLDVQNARTTAGRIESDTKIDIANAKLQAQLEKLRAARSRLDTALSVGRARIVNFSGDLLNYQAELRDWLTDNTDEILENITQKESQRDLDVTGLRDLSRREVNVIQFNTEAQNIADLGNLNAEVISKSADLTAKTEITSKLIHSLVAG